MATKQFLMRPRQGSQISMNSNGSNIDYNNVYIELNAAIDELNERVYKDMQTSGIEFLSAYREHMKKVQQDLVQIKKKNTQGYFMIKKDERVLKLGAQLNFFRDEALNLSKKLNGLRDDNKRLQDRL